MAASIPSFPSHPSLLPSLKNHETGLSGERHNEARIKTGTDVAASVLSSTRHSICAALMPATPSYAPPSPPNAPAPPSDTPKRMNEERSNKEKGKTRLGKEPEQNWQNPFPLQPRLPLPPPPVQRPPLLLLLRPAPNTRCAHTLPYVSYTCLNVNITLFSLSSFDCNPPYDPTLDFACADPPRPDFTSDSPLWQGVPLIRSLQHQGKCTHKINSNTVTNPSKKYKNRK